MTGRSHQGRERADPMGGVEHGPERPGVEIALLLPEGDVLDVRLGSCTVGVVHTGGGREHRPEYRPAWVAPRRLQRHCGASD
ncbi:hypothetical protein Sm713_69420 [Streptomyces sp. TS71-3]|nr:hypothetical protein Sm713_69420 [Streptomyces sp. TS71-3]